MSAAALLCLLSAVAAVENGGFTNLDFEQGAAGWGVWYSDNPTAPMVKYPYAADPTVAHEGRQSMRIEAPSEQGLAFVNRSAEGMQPGNRYEVSYWIRTTPELDERAFKVQFNFRPAAADAGWVMQSASPLVTVRRTEGEWRFRAGSLSIPKDASTTIQLGLYLREARGTIWIDDIRIREIPASEYALADLWIYDPHRVELGNAPITKFNALKVAHPELVARAQRYNELLVSSADRKEDVRRVARLAGYGLLDGAPAVALSTAMDQAEVLLAAAYRAYGEAYLAPGDGARLTA
ncbi:MAG: hypothetical protein HUU35_05795, partial [Armatimonadetes bacterium]|nr:hypothetical protein [Armatimonadota bacterium]